MEIPKRTEGKANRDVGMYDFYAYYRKKYYKTSKKHAEVDSKLYRKIVSEFNKIIGGKIVKEHMDFKMPFKLGRICFRKYKKKPKKDEEGNYKYELPVNWKETLKLWERNEEARKNKKLVKHLNKDTGGYIFKIHYKKDHANYKNKSAYTFKCVRRMKHLIRDTVRKGNTDCYEL